MGTPLVESPQLSRMLSRRSFEAASTWWTSIAAREMAERDKRIEMLTEGFSYRQPQENPVEHE